MKTSNIFSASEASPATHRRMETVADLHTILRCTMAENRPGVLTTIDQQGIPHARWMGTVAADDFPNLYTLTNPASRKLAHIAFHPIVNWMFSNSELSMVVNLIGPAHVESDMDVIQKIWNSITDKTHAYFMKEFGGSEGCAIIKTTVEMVECSLPLENRFWRQDVSCPSVLQRDHFDA